MQEKFITSLSQSCTMSPKRPYSGLVTICHYLGNQSVEIIIKLDTDKFHLGMRLNERLLFNIK